MLPTSIPVIIGPTAVGKTAAALHIASQASTPIELVSVDSQQVYIGMDIGTGKEVDQGQWQDNNHRPTLIINHIPIHGLNLVSPDQEFSVHQWQQTIFQIIQEIQQRQHQPLLVGGTGFYLQALQGNIDTLAIKPNQQLRQQLSIQTADQLLAQLHQLNPAKAQSLNHSDRHNPARLIRAIEVAHHQTDSNTLTSKPHSKLSLQLIGLTAPRPMLYAKADQRVDDMIAQGLVAEVEQLVQRFNPHQQAFQAIGYRQIIQHLQGQISLDQAIADIKSQTHSYIRRQYTWFNKQNIDWVDRQNPQWLDQLKSKLALN